MLCRSLATLFALFNGFWGESWCPGLVTKPQPRAEPFNVKFAEELAREVREADAGEVSCVQRITMNAWLEVARSF